MWIIFFAVWGYFLWSVWGLFVGILTGAFWLLVSWEIGRAERRLREGWTYEYDPETNRVTWRRP